MLSPAGEDGFVWLDELLDEGASRSKDGEPLPQARGRRPSVGKLRPVEAAWGAPIRWRRLFARLALSAFGGRRSVIRACIALAEAVTADLYAALQR